MLEMTTTTGATQTMSSLEISKLVESRHDKVRQSIERLAERGVISLPPMGEVSNDGPGPKTINVYNLRKRDSLIVVAQLCPEFTARIVDRWQELEEQAAKPALNPANLSRLQLIEIAMQAEQERLALEHKVEELEPKASALDRLATPTEGAVGLRIAAKLMQMPEKQFLQFANAEGFIFRNHYSGTWQGYSEKAKAGLVELKFTKVERSDGTEKTVEQVLITRAGLAKLAAIHERRVKCAPMSPPSTRLNSPPSSSPGL
jgi:phage regulator Rha-like protein